ncbi:MAG TPA: nucleotidyltransferase substrate binding protein [Candidatus Brocadiia bacterium]|nr:nucleotidyltransferase substrate binding protein [Candidatus Brocadiia bacterium]
MDLDLTSLQKAVKSLEDTVAVARDLEFMSELNEFQQNAVRAGVIQNFEFTFELCWKFMRRWVHLNTPLAEADPLTQKALFRAAAREGLIEDPVRWFAYSDARNATSHTYDGAVAREVFEMAAQFLGDAKRLLDQLERHND